MRPHVQWRRLPWFIIAYVAWATASLLWSAWPASTALTLILLLGHDPPGAVHRQRADLARDRPHHRVGPQMGPRPVARVRTLGVDLHPRAHPARLRRRGGGRSDRVLVAQQPLRGRPPAGHHGQRESARAGRAARRSSCSPSASPPARPAAPCSASGSASSAYLFYRAVVGHRLHGGGRRRDRPRHGPADAPREAAGRAHEVLRRLSRRRSGRRARAVAAARPDLHGARAQRRPHRTRERSGQRCSSVRTSGRSIGWGFATPWVPWDPAFDGWIIDHGVTVMQAHNMWVDVYLQLGLIGLVIMGAASTSRRPGARGSSPSTGRGGTCARTVRTRRSRCCPR